MSDSPVEQELKAGSRGNGDWPGFSAVYSKISSACDKLGRVNRGGEFHVSTMADLGSGDESRMKNRLALLRVYGWLD